MLQQEIQDLHRFPGKISKAQNEKQVPFICQPRATNSFNSPFLIQDRYCRQYLPHPRKKYKSSVLSTLDRQVTRTHLFLSRFCPSGPIGGLSFLPKSLFHSELPLNYSLSKTSIKMVPTSYRTLMKKEVTR